MSDNALMLYTSFEPIRKISKAKAISVTFIRRYFYIYIYTYIIYTYGI